MKAERVAFLGVSGSGKTELARRRYIRHAPRVLVVDQTGEWRKNYPHWQRATGLEETRRTLAGILRQDAQRWQLITYLKAYEVEDLAALLIPVGDVYEKSPVRAFGGFAMYLDEVDIVLPASGVSEEMRSLYRRGRHAGLSIWSATQRPGSTSKEITANATAVHIFPLHEPGDVKYVDDLVGKEQRVKLMEWNKAVKYRYATFRPETGEVEYNEPA